MTTGAATALSLAERVGQLPVCTMTGATKFLYLCVFPSVIKIGVSGSLYSRIGVMQAKRRERFECVYFAELPADLAWHREARIKREWGEQTIGKTGRWTGFFSEWLDRALLIQVIGAMLVDLDAKSSRFPDYLGGSLPELPSVGRHAAQHGALLSDGGR